MFSRSYHTLNEKHILFHSKVQFIASVLYCMQKTDQIVSECTTKFIPRPSPPCTQSIDIMHYFAAIRVVT